MPAAAPCMHPAGGDAQRAERNQAGPAPRRKQRGQHQHQQQERHQPAQKAAGSVRGLRRQAAEARARRAPRRGPHSALGQRKVITTATVDERQLDPGVQAVEPGVAADVDVKLEDIDISAGVRSRSWHAEQATSRCATAHHRRQRSAASRRIRSRGARTAPSARPSNRTRPLRRSTTRSPRTRPSTARRG